MTLGFRRTDSHDTFICSRTSWGVHFSFSKVWKQFKLYISIYVHVRKWEATIRKIQKNFSIYRWIRTKISSFSPVTFLIIQSANFSTCHPKKKTIFTVNCITNKMFASVLFNLFPLAFLSLRRRPYYNYVCHVLFCSFSFNQNEYWSILSSCKAAR
jgi:hypothetical protein